MSALGLELGLGGLLVVVLVATLAARGEVRRWLGRLAAIGAVALALASFAVVPSGPAFGGLLALDALAVYAKRLFLVATALALLGGAGGAGGVLPRRSGEYHLLVLASALGMLLLASARDLVLLFVAFELMSIPLYALTGFAKRRGESVEAGLKFFLVGSVSSAVMAYGFSFVYGAARATSLDAVARAAAAGHPLLTLGLALAFAGLGFKIAAFPFHMWVPDAYEAGPTPFVAWLSVAPKAAGFVVLLRLYYEGVGPAAALWAPWLAALAAATVVAGNLMALPQQNVKRLLAYSGVAHMGYMLVGLAPGTPDGAGMVLFYLAAYVFGNMGAFLVVEAVERSEGSPALPAFRGLAERSPLLALAMLLCLLSLGGIPFVAGFWAKLYVLWAAAAAGLYWLVLLGALLTVVALFYYLLIARRMYIEVPAGAGPIPLDPGLRLAILLCVAGVVALGVWPGGLVAAALSAAAPLF